MHHRAEVQLAAREGGEFKAATMAAVTTVGPRRLRIYIAGKGGGVNGGELPGATTGDGAGAECKAPLKG